MGNAIGIDEAPGVIFTKVLNLPDTVMRNYAQLVTRWEQEAIDAMFAELAAGALEMREFKQRLAWEIVSIFHGDEAADRAVEDARRMFEGQAPSDAAIFRASSPINVLDVLFDAGLVASKGEGRRLVQQGGVRVNGELISSNEHLIDAGLDGETVIQAGKRKFVRVVPA